MTILGSGTIAPDFTLPAFPGGKFKLSNQRGKFVVLYFYPQDDTPGCTNENIDFSRLKDEFEQMNTMVVGISPDTLEKHTKFAKKHELKCPLLADPDRVAIEQYGAWGMKKTFGKEYEGLIRTTYLLDPNGKIAQSWRVTRVKGHAENVLATVRELSD